MMKSIKNLIMTRERERERERERVDKKDFKVNKKVWTNLSSFFVGATSFLTNTKRIAFLSLLLLSFCP